VAEDGGADFPHSATDSRFYRVEFNDEVVRARQQGARALADAGCRTPQRRDRQLKAWKSRSRTRDQSDAGDPASHRLD
jgi:hypothetical protein